MKISIIASLATLILLTGCTLRGPSITVSGPEVIVDDSSKGKVSEKNKGSFCPPGQAKKGNC
ncbi:hypothetical protein [Psychromonas sp. SA13A]|jgi:hypothetical protein|uniref:hypothetical protein n=1 Tax=Psychromonas sp. SA13A TaxID=2686346 RepID=UPI00140B7895|nr:hypothetical protein [Psychromonas sp. SA13A]